MTFFHSVIDLKSSQQDNAPQPAPRSPEEVIHLLTQEAPHGEYSVDMI